MSEGQPASLFTWVRDVLTSEPVIAGIVGLITGAIGSLIAPWVQWGVEKRRRRFESRREQITAWRTAVDRDDFRYQLFAQGNVYATLRPHLPGDLRQTIDQWRSPGIVTSLARMGRDPIQVRLLEEIAKVERKWGLV
jgi:hypothetical protein